MEQKHTHWHGPDHAHGEGAQVHGQPEGPMLWLSLLITIVFVIGEAIAGYLSHSLALLSDAGHNFSDGLALGLAAYALWISKRPTSAAKTYGWHRATILSALVNATTLLVIAALIVIEAVFVFRHPRPVQGVLMMWVAGASVLMNTVVAALLRGGAKESLNVRAAYIHMAGDALSAVGVLVAGWVVASTGWVYADPLVSLLIAGFIVWSSIGVVTDAVNVLLEGTPKGLDVERMVAAMQQVHNVVTVHDVHVWTVSDNLNFLSAHIGVADVRTMEECGEIIREVKELLGRDFQIAHATIQVESTGSCCERADSDPLHCHDITTHDAEQQQAD
jgi:cobalt-zinc-cadmium efflux system protein